MTIQKRVDKEVVALKVILECPFCEDYIGDDITYLFKYNDRIMITCEECGCYLTTYLHIKCLDMGSCQNAGQCEGCTKKFKCYTTRG